MAGSDLLRPTLAGLWGLQVALFSEEALLDSCADLGCAMVQAATLG